VQLLSTAHVAGLVLAQTVDVPVTYCGVHQCLAIECHPAVPCMLLSTAVQQQTHHSCSNFQLDPSSALLGVLCRHGASQTTSKLMKSTNHDNSAACTASCRASSLCPASPSAPTWLRATVGISTLSAIIPLCSPVHMHECLLAQLPNSSTYTSAAGDLHTPIFLIAQRKQMVLTVV
jgi:hypothetical protein